MRYIPEFSVKNFGLHLLKSDSKNPLHPSSKLPPEGRLHPWLGLMDES
jgi:hypothetical protein